MTSQTWLDLAARIGPIIVFLLAITVTAEIAERAGVFDVAGHAVARWGRHRTWLLWLLFALLAVACTVFLSLDTTAVLLTPVGLAIARQVGMGPLPFALTTLWIANTGSLLLPVSNLTNLLALQRFAAVGVDHAAYVRLAALPALVAVLATLAIIAVLRRKDLAGRFTVDAPPVPHDRGLLWTAGIVCVVVGPLFAIGLPPAWVSTGSAVVLVAAALWRSPALLRTISVPWLMALGFAAVAALVTWANGQGLTVQLAGWAGSGTSTGALLRVAAVGAGVANTVNNLPAYLALEPTVAAVPARLMALLIGVNAGPLVTPWGSLATLLWLQRCRSAGVTIPPLKLALAGLACAVATVVLATAALAVTS
ncbi:MAG: SLC13 family permease [Nostocoides sp.]